jgi:tripartite-type tricarboxylate transporter receptor subunit TctC
LLGRVLIKALAMSAYKGGGPSMLAVIAGEAQIMFSSIVQTVSNIKELGQYGVRLVRLVCTVPSLIRSGA